MVESAIKDRQRDDALNRDSNDLMTQHFTHRGIRYGLALVIAAAIVGAAAPGFAQNVPVPKPAPKGRDGTQMSAQDSIKGPTTTGATQAAPNPVIPDPHRNVPANIFA